MLTTSNSAGIYTFTYDGLGRVSTQTDPNGYLLSFSYDANNNVTSVSDWKNGVLGGTISSSYNNDNILISRSQSGNGIPGVQISLGYNNDNQLIQIDRYNNSVNGTLVSQTELTVDGNGNITNEIVQQV